MDEKFVPFYPYVSAVSPKSTDKEIDATLKQYMDEAMPLESDEGMEKRAAVLLAVEAIFRKFVKNVGMNILKMSEEEAEDAGGELRISGSHRLGVRDQGADIDTICVAPNFVTREHFFSLMKKDLLEHPDVTELLAIETATVPMIGFCFQGINFDLLFARLSTHTVPRNFDILSDDVLKDIDDATEKTLNGPRVTDMVPKLACKAKDSEGQIIEHGAFKSLDVGGKENTFLIVLRCVRKWAKKRGLYANKMGYFGGVNCNILVALVCQLFPHATASTLLVLFFRTYAGWAWPKPVQLNRIQPNPPTATYGELKDVWNAGERWYDLMPIITPAYPAFNSSLSVNVHTRDVINEEFKIAFKKCETIKARLEAEGPSAWDALFEPSDFFIKYSHYLQVHVLGTGDDEASTGWIGYCEARLRGFPQYLEALPLCKPIHLYPVQSKTEKSANSVSYFIGFNVDRERFNPDKPLHVDKAAYNFHKMLVDKYKGTMKEGLEWYVEHFPWKKLPKKLFEPLGGWDTAKKLRKEREYGKYAKKTVEEEGKGEKKEDVGEVEEKTDMTAGEEDEGGIRQEIIKGRKRVIQPDFPIVASDGSLRPLPPPGSHSAEAGATSEKRPRSAAELDQEYVEARRLRHLESRSKDVHWLLDASKA